MTEKLAKTIQFFLPEGEPRGNSLPSWRLMR